MPIFEYRCRGCGEVFEELVSSSRAGSPRCPACGADDVERLPSTFAVAGSMPEPELGPCGSPDCACRRS